MRICNLWWLRRCLRCQARKTYRLTVRWPVISIPLPPASSTAVSMDFFGTLSDTLRGNTYILLSPTVFSAA